jgi:hypothetical protein
MIPNVLNAEIFKFQILAKRKKNVSNNAYRPYKVLTLTTYSKIAHACVRKSWCIHILAEAPWGDFSLSYSDGEKREVFCTIVFSQLAVTSIKKLFRIQKNTLVLNHALKSSSGGLADTSTGVSDSHSFSQM